MRNIIPASPMFLSRSSKSDSSSCPQEKNLSRSSSEPVTSVKLSWSMAMVSMGSATVRLLCCRKRSLIVIYAGLHTGPSLRRAMAWLRKSAARLFGNTTAMCPMSDLYFCSMSAATDSRKVFIK